MDIDFQHVMAERTDKELVIIVSTDRHKYQKAALDAAEIEIEKRKIDPVIITNLTEKVKVENSILESISSKKTPIKNRALNQVIDYSAIVLLCYLINFIISVISNLADDLQGLIFLIVYFSYYIYMEIIFQQTFGKLYTKTKVVTLDGDKPTLRQIITRTSLRIIPYDIISFFIEKNGFHDSLSKTTVIDM